MQTPRLISTDNILIAKYNIEVWLIEKDIFDFYQDTSYLFALNKDQFSFTVEFSKLIFTYWTENKSESWQIINHKIKNDLLYFDAYLPFKKQVIKLLLKPQSISNLLNLPKYFIDRKGYLSRLCSLINTEFPMLNIRKSTVNHSLRLNSQIGVARLLLSDENSSIIAAVGISKYEKNDSLPTLLAEGLKWLRVLKSSFNPITIDKLMIFAPTQLVILLAERLTLISQSQQKIELFEVDEIEGKVSFVNPFDQGDLGLSLASNIKLSTNKSKSKPIDLCINEQIEWIKSLAPNLIESNLKNNKLNLHINGLSFATVYLSQIPYISFGDKKKLSLENKLELENLVREIAFYRHSNSPNKQHHYYHTLAERWLENIIKHNLSSLDPTLTNCFYHQVSVTKQNNRFIDLLAIDNEGQLVIIELKAVEDLDLPFQGLDYWLRIEWYRLRGDLGCKGYFPNMKLKDMPAKVYLVMPKLRCHREFNYLASLVDKKVPLYSIAINDNWRKELRIESKEKVN